MSVAGFVVILIATPTMSNSAAYTIWVCIVCGFLYDEALGLPDEGLPAGTRWGDVPKDWQCPDCGVGKADFEMVEA